LIYLTESTLDTFVVLGSTTVTCYCVCCWFRHDFFPYIFTE